MQRAHIYKYVWLGTPFSEMRLGHHNEWVIRTTTACWTFMRLLRVDECIFAAAHYPKKTFFSSILRKLRALTVCVIKSKRVSLWLTTTTIQNNKKKYIFWGCWLNRRWCGWRQNPLVYVCWHSRTIYPNDGGGIAMMPEMAKRLHHLLCDILLYVLCIVFVVIYFEIFKFVRQQPRQLPQYGTNGHYYMTCGGCLKPWTRFGLWINTITFWLYLYISFWYAILLLGELLANQAFLEWQLEWTSEISVKYTWAAHWYLTLYLTILKNLRIFRPEWIQTNEDFRYNGQNYLKDKS